MDKPVSSNPWDSLSTATSFDAGTKPTARLDSTTNQSNQLTATYSTPTSLLICSLVRQLCVAITGDSNRRKKLYFAVCDELYKLKLIDSSYAAMELEPVRSQYWQALYRLFTVALAATANGEDEIVRLLPPERSRYDEEFQEISLIASGGFGNVFKALHRLDGIEYAVKKVIVRSDRVGRIVERLDEVKTLARLNHENIVGYKGAWIEPSLPANLWMGEGEEELKEIGDSLEEEERSSSSGSNSITFRSEEEESGTQESDSGDDRSKERMLLPYVSGMCKNYTTLYIQMSLCEKTLQRWMEERVGSTPQTMIVAISTQIISGLDYIHSRGIVHHDVKPSNIFISTGGQLQIQLGDFGLACPLRKESHGSVVGTHMYAAPEQLQGKCDPKSDVYSLGIVLVELLVQTETRMEKIEIINGLKKEQIPTALAAAYPKWAHVVSQLVQRDPKKRPTTNQLLLELNEGKDTVIARLRNDVAERDRLIEVLEARISRLQQQIANYSNDPNI